MKWQENWNRTKEMFGAAWRQGLRELGAALYGPNTIAQHPEYGGVWTKTPGEVAEGRKSNDRDRDEEPFATLHDRVAQADKERDFREPEPAEPERE